jgi:hypothetical protein
MAFAKTAAGKGSWLLIPARVLLVTFLGTLLAFALSLLVGIIGIVVSSWVQGMPPNMTLAYREIALPGAALAGLIVLVGSIVVEVRHYRQMKTLAGIERVSR